MGLYAGALNNLAEHIGRWFLVPRTVAVGQIAKLEQRGHGERLNLGCLYQFMPIGDQEHAPTASVGDQLTAHGIGESNRGFVVAVGVHQPAHIAPTGAPEMGQ